MATDEAPAWAPLAAAQEGVLARRQLTALGYDHHWVGRQIRARRWQAISEVVVASHTGPLTQRQRMWAGVLHAGPGSAVAGMTALSVAGLRGWHRDRVSVLLPKSRGLRPVAGIDFTETRRPVRAYCGPGDLPVWKVEPAALLTAAYLPSTRTAYGLLAAVVQQGLTTPERLEGWLQQMRPLRRAKMFGSYLGDLAGGVQSLAESDVQRLCSAARLQQPTRQVGRRDASGRWRYTDCEWRLAGGRLLILEIDGGFHMDAGHWGRDIERERDLVLTGAIVLRCTALEARTDPGRIAEALRRAGVPPARPRAGRSSAPGAPDPTVRTDDPAA